MTLRQGDIKSASIEVEDEDATLTDGLIETMGDSGGRKFVDDTENVQVVGGTSTLVA